LCVFINVWLYLCLYIYYIYKYLYIYILTYSKLLGYETYFISISQNMLHSVNQNILNISWFAIYYIVIYLLCVWCSIYCKCLMNRSTLPLLPYSSAYILPYNICIINIFPCSYPHKYLQLQCSKWVTIFSGLLLI